MNKTSVNSSYKDYIIICKTEKDMLKLGSELATHLKEGDVVSLRGNLGSGKTVLVKGTASKLGIKETITSPTFTLVQTYKGKLNLYHLDLYRLNSEEDFYNIGGLDYLSPDGISMIEWTEVINNLLPENTYFIDIEILDDLSRKVSIKHKEV